MAVKLNADAYRELKQVIRDYKNKGRVEKVLTNIQHAAYQQGYQDAYTDASKKIYEAVNADYQSANTSNDLDGEQLQSDSSVVGTSEGIDAIDSDSGPGSESGVWQSDGVHPKSV